MTNKIILLDKAEAELTNGLNRLAQIGGDWFFQKVESTFAMDTGRLRASYKGEFIGESTPERLKMVIGSNVSYAPHVEKMSGVNWTFQNTVEQAATKSGLQMSNLIEGMIRGAFS